MIQEYHSHFTESFLPNSLPKFITMDIDMATKQSIELAVAGILRSSDMDSVTEADVRAMAAAELGLDLSGVSYKVLVRETIESFLVSTAPPPETEAAVGDAVAGILNSGELTVREVVDAVRKKVGLEVFVLPRSDVVRHIVSSVFEAPAPEMVGVVAEEVMRSCDGRMRDVLTVLSEKFGLKKVRDSLFSSSPIRNDAGEEEEEDMKPEIVPVDKQNPVASDCRVICKLSSKRGVAVKGYGKKLVVSIRELTWKNGKQIPSPTIGISLSSDQWSVFRNSIPAIEEAIQTVEARLRSELEKKQAEDKQPRSQLVSKHNDETQNRAEPKQNGTRSTHHEHRSLMSRKHAAESSAVSSAPLGIVPIGIIRFDGNNYLKWADRMESYLNQLKIAYVLSDPCPSAAGVTGRALSETLSAVQKWVDDDHICRQNILNSLCDNLYSHYSKKSGTARDLWEEMKLVYLNEEYGTKVSLVKKYTDFQMNEEKSIFEQVQELHEIADSLIAHGMYVEEKFHVNVIISKLPSSWKPFSIQLMKEDYLPVWMLMNLLKAEEETRGKRDKGEAILPRPEVPISQPNTRLGPQRAPMKKPGGPPANHEPDRNNRKVKFCSVCKKKGHLPEQCWSRKSGGKDTTPSEKGRTESVPTVPGRNMDGATD